MLVAIGNDPRPYAWGSTSAIAAYLGRAESGQPEAELWLGAHAGSPARILDPSAVGGYPDLAKWIAAEPVVALGAELAPSARLPFLLKVLAAASPLSLQAHPTPEQAARGFAGEEYAGKPVDAPDRNYRDPCHKPELVVAVSETFDALCGFRPIEEIHGILGSLRRLDATDAHPRPDLLDQLAGPLATNNPLPTLVALLLDRTTDVGPLVAHLGHLADRATGAGWLDPAHAAALATVRELAAAYPGDPGIAVSLLVHRVTLHRGEALYLPAGNIHAYLRGLGIELMAASDNVLRGGLTSKHIDVPELLGVLDFTPQPVPLLDPDRPAAGVRVFRPGVADFLLVQVELDRTCVDLDLDGPAIVLATRGAAHLVGSGGTAAARRGDAYYVTPDEGRLHLHGHGEVFLATTGGAPVRVVATPDPASDPTSAAA
jgi:mannose-6-phosphate isomerase